MSSASSHGCRTPQERESPKRGLYGSECFALYLLRHWRCSPRFSQPGIKAFDHLLKRHEKEHENKYTV